MNIEFAYSILHSLYLDLIIDQQGTNFVAARSQFLQESLRCNVDSTLTLDGLDNDSASFRGNKLVNGGHIVVGGVDKTRNEGEEWLLVLWVGGGGEGAHGASMETVHERDDTKLVVFLSGLSSDLGDFAGKLERTLVGLGARVGKEDLGSLEVSRGASGLD